MQDAYKQVCFRSMSMRVPEIDELVFSDSTVRLARARVEAAHPVEQYSPRPLAGAGFRPVIWRHFLPDLHSFTSGTTATGMIFLRTVGGLIRYP